MVPQGCSPTELAKIAPPSPTIFGAFGASTAVSGDTLLVGDPSDSELGLGVGAIHVFRMSAERPGEWRWTGKLHASDATHGMKFGWSLAVDGNILVAGSELDSSLGVEEAGAAYVFERSDEDSDDWIQTAKIFASDPFRAALFGEAVEVSGSTILVSAPLAKPRNKRTGAVYVFEKKNPDAVGGWQETQRLSPRLDKELLEFGRGIALSGTNIAVGAPNDNGSGIQGGAVYMYRRIQEVWQLDAKLVAPDAAVNDRLGSVALCGNQVIAGAPGDDDQGTASGSAYVFTKGTEGWQFTQKLLPVPGEAGWAFGSRLAADGDLLVVSAPQSDALAEDAGVVHAFHRLSDGSWLQSGLLMPSELQPQDFMYTPTVSDGFAVLGIITFPVGGTVHVFDTRLERSFTTYCVASDTGDPDCVPVLEAVGNATASGTSEFRLRAGPVPSGQLGFFAYTHAPSGLPVGNSAWTCLPGPALGRSQLLLSGGTFGACDGHLELDWNDLLAANAGQDPALAEPGTHVYGQFVHFQFGSAGRVQQSEAVAFVTCP